MQDAVDLGRTILIPKSFADAIALPFTSTPGFHSGNGRVQLVHIELPDGLANAPTDRTHCLIGQPGLVHECISCHHQTSAGFLKDSLDQHARIGERVHGLVSAFKGQHGEQTPLPLLAKPLVHQQIDLANESGDGPPVDYHLFARAATDEYCDLSPPDPNDRSDEWRFDAEGEPHNLTDEGCTFFRKALRTIDDAQTAGIISTFDAEVECRRLAAHLRTTECYLHEIKEEIGFAVRRKRFCRSFESVMHISMTNWRRAEIWQ